MTKRKIIHILGSVVLLGLLIFLAFNKHSKSKLNSYQSVIWADKAGYNVYLPAALNYDFDARLFPDSIDLRTGNGFSLNMETGKVSTKYTYGVALMQLPFYLSAQVLAPYFNMERSGYSRIYVSVLYLAAVFYFFFGIRLLYKFLRFKSSPKVSVIAVTSLFLGSNLYFYTIEDSGMSHVYSFFLFSAFLYLLRRTSFLRDFRIWPVFLFGIISALIVLIRPTNVMFLLAYFFLDASTRNEIIVRLKRLTSLNYLSVLLISTALIWLPQILYWHYLSGHYFLYSYAEEGFSWLNPKFLYTWFAPMNGLFLYAPLYLLLIYGAFKMWMNKVDNGLFLICLFALISFVFASWWDWSFGCGFGARSFVEYFAIFSLALCYLIEESNKDKIRQTALLGGIVLLISFNLKLIYSYDMCFFGDGPWDWKYYLQLVTGPTK